MSQKDSSLSDQAAAEIASESYKRNKKNIKIPGDEKNVYNVVETIEDKDTGLHGYVLKNKKSSDIIISFEGTQLEEGWDQGFNDVVEDATGIVFGSSDYTEEEHATKTYHGTPEQDALIEAGGARVEDGKFIQLNKNQFTEADKVVKKQIEEHGAENITFVGHSLGGAMSKYFAIKYDSHAVTFGAPDTYNLLTDEEKKQVDSGDFDSNIISYTYPDDILGTFRHRSIGSTFYMEDPKDAGYYKTFDNHGMKNYTDEDMFDDEGYFIPQLLTDETLFGPLHQSPLALKNSGQDNFPILIKSLIMESFVTDIEKNITLIENTETALEDFWDLYSEEMNDLKSTYLSKVGTEEYDLLSAADVEEVFDEIGKKEEGVPLLFSLDQYEDILNRIRYLYNDTGEIAFHMKKLSKDFEEADELLARWLQF